MTEGSRGPRGRLGAIVLALAGVAAGAWAVLFFVANGTWVVVHLPDAPWKSAPETFAFETRLFALILVCLAIGALGTAVLTRRHVRRIERRAAEDRARALRLENEMKNLGKLVASSRHKG